MHNAVGGDVFFILMGAILVFAMHAGFAFLEVGTVEQNQVNALVKIISDFGVSTIAYFFVGYGIAYGLSFLTSAEMLSGAGEGFRRARSDIGEVFLPADIRCRHSGHYFGRHCRARAVRPAASRFRLDCRRGLSDF